MKKILSLALALVMLEFCSSVLLSSWMALPVRLPMVSVLVPLTVSRLAAVTVSVPAFRVPLSTSVFP